MKITDEIVYFVLSQYLGFEPDLKVGDNAERFQRMRWALEAAFPERSGEE